MLTGNLLDSALKSYCSWFYVVRLSMRAYFIPYLK